MRSWAPFWEPKTLTYAQNVDFWSPFGFQGVPKLVLEFPLFGKKNQKNGVPPTTGTLREATLLFLKPYESPSRWDLLFFTTSFVGV